MTPTTKHIEEVVKEFEKNYRGEVFMPVGGFSNIEYFSKREVADFLRTKLQEVVEARDREVEELLRENIHRYQQSRGVCTSCAMDIVVYRTLELLSPSKQEKGCCEKCDVKLFARGNDKQGYFVHHCNDDECPCHQQ